MLPKLPAACVPSPNQKGCAPTAGMDITVSLTVGLRVEAHTAKLLSGGRQSKVIETPNPSPNPRINPRIRTKRRQCCDSQ